MSEQVLLSSIALDGVREQGGFGQPLHTLYQQLCLILRIELGEESAALLAEPVIDRVRNRIDWYTQGDAQQTPLPLETLPEAQREALLAQVQEQLARGREVAERYLASGNAQRMQLGAALQAVLQPVDASHIMLLNERPLLLYWGFTTDRAWEVLPHTVARVAELASVPEVAAPLQAAAATSATDIPEPVAAASEPALTVPLDPPLAPPPLAETAAEPLAIPVTPTLAGRDQQRPMLQSSRSSRYFWIALLLLLIAVVVIFFWDRAGRPQPWANTPPASTQDSTAPAAQSLENAPLAPNAASPANAGSGSTAQPSTSPTAQDSTAPAAQSLENALLTPNAGSVSTAQPSTAPTALGSTAPAAQSLENALLAPNAASAMPIEPTAEERREFAKRLSVSGAKSGAISASLLWNGSADLDLVVICPNGQSVDYQNPSNCAGKLDVDANALRGQLKEKPVENIFWAAGAAAPGTYKVAVRYKPRKDERHPQPTPFQLRLNYEQQEQVFKGMAQPGKLGAVTTFTVPER